MSRSGIPYRSHSKTCATPCSSATKSRSLDVREEDPHAQQSSAVRREPAAVEDRTGRLPCACRADGAHRRVRCRRRTRRSAPPTVSPNSAIPTSPCSKAVCKAGVDAGGELFRDVNVPSKAFGEFVEAQRHTPSLSRRRVRRCSIRGDDVVVLDARRFDEYQTMNIPGSISVPGAELVLRARAARAGSEDARHRQLRGAHAQHHRHAVAGECRACRIRSRRCAMARSAGRSQASRSSMAARDASSRIAGGRSHLDASRGRPRALVADRAGVGRTTLR